MSLLLIDIQKMEEIEMMHLGHHRYYLYSIPLRVRYLKMTYNFDTRECKVVITSSHTSRPRSDGPNFSGNYERWTHWTVSNELERQDIKM